MVPISRSRPSSEKNLRRVAQRFDTHYPNWESLALIDPAADTRRREAADPTTVKGSRNEIKNHENLVCRIVWRAGDDGQCAVRSDAESAGQQGDDSGAGDGGRRKEVIGIRHSPVPRRASRMQQNDGRSARRLPQATRLQVRGQAVPQPYRRKAGRLP